MLRQQDALAEVAPACGVEAGLAEGARHGAVRRGHGLAGGRADDRFAREGEDDGGVGVGGVVAEVFLLVARCGLVEVRPLAEHHGAQPRDGGEVRPHRRAGRRLESQVFGHRGP